MGFMNIHPAEIAREIIKWNYFKSLPESSLFKLTVMMDAKVYEAGEVILPEGQRNHHIFFLRQGQVEVFLADQKLAELTKAGDVFGEMSVVSGRPTSTTLKARSKVEVFRLDSEYLNQIPAVDQPAMKLLLYHIYTLVLIERLTKTNERARLFEINNPDLYQAQVKLESVGPQKVLIVETNKTKLMIAKLAVGGTGVELETTSDLEEAGALIESKDYDAILVDERDFIFLEKLEQKKIRSKLVLLCEKEVKERIGLFRKALFADSIISVDPEDRNFTIRSLLISMNKVLTVNFFGPEKYLSFGAELQSRKVQRSNQRMELREDVRAYFKRHGLRTTLLDRIDQVLEELLMNSIYDAPTDDKGQAVFNHLDRKTTVELSQDQEAELRFGSDGVLLAISVRDPFGSLTKDTLIQYLDSGYRGEKNPLHVGKGGGGQGLRLIIEQSDLTIINIREREETEFICLFNIEAHKKESHPSFHLFFQKK